MRIFSYLLDTEDSQLWRHIKDKNKNILENRLRVQQWVITVQISNRCGRVMANNIAYAKFRTNLII